MVRVRRARLHGKTPHQSYAALYDQRELGPCRHTRLDAVADAMQAGAWLRAALAAGQALRCSHRRANAASRMPPR